MGFHKHTINRHKLVRFGSIVAYNKCMVPDERYLYQDHPPLVCLHQWWIDSNVVRNTMEHSTVPDSIFGVVGYT